MDDNQSSEYYSNLNLPRYDMKIMRGVNVLKVFDQLRKKYVALTPEEYVRQHFVNWLISYKHYPASLMANEIGIDLNGTRRRCDTIVFDKNGIPFIIVEYKAPEIAISQKVFDQIVRYNMVLQARYLIVSNGKSHYCCVIDYPGKTYHFIPEIPDYKDLTKQNAGS